MGPYQRGQSRSSPGVDNIQSSNDIELQEQLEDQEKAATMASEESERLLPGEEGGGIEYDDVRSKGLHAPRRPYRKWLRLALFGLAGIILLSIAAALLGRGSAAEDERRTVRKFRRPSLDYTIPRNWDFDAPPEARYQRWTITDITANPDGVFRSLTVINGKFPGPVIVANEGDTIVVDVTNHGQNATSIHWHGIFQNGTNSMDGAVGVTQCPIAPGESFRYQFTVAGQAGTCRLTSQLPPKRVQC